MKTTTAGILSVVPQLAKLRGLGIITVLTAKRNGKALDLVQKELDAFEVARKEAVKKYDVSDKKESDVSPEAWAGFQREFKELLEEEHEFSCFPLPIPGSATGLTTHDVEVLEKAGFIAVQE
jgi:hypothetical protein